MENLDEITLYRFRVRTADGREAVSRVVATRRAPKPRLGGEEEALGEDEMPQAMLANPRWSEDLFAHGDHATMLVDAPGLEGRTVRFHVEHRHKGDWTDYDKVDVKVENGMAAARLQLRHPGAGEANADPADMRFACELL